MRTGRTPRPGSGGSQRRERGAIRLASRALSWLATVTIVLACGAWVISGSAWRADLLANLTAQVGLTWLAVATLWAALRWWGRLCCLLPGGLLLALALVPGRAPGAPKASPGLVRVMTFNAFNVDTMAEPPAAALAGSEADVMTIIEPTYSVCALLNSSDSFRERYPYLAPGRPYPSRPTIVSRWPVEHLHLRYGPVEEGQAKPGMSPTGVIVRRPEGAFILIAIHPPSPRSADAWANGNEAILRLADIVNELRAEHALPIVIGGDFNSTPTGWRSRRLRSETGLRRGKPMLRMMGTWPGDRSWPARLAIDDVFVSPGIGVASWTPLPAPAGGDHSPVVVELVIPAPTGSGPDPASQSMPQKSSGLP